MRKILLLSSVFAMSFGVFAHNNQADAVWARQVETQRNLNKIWDKVIENGEKIDTANKDNTDKQESVNEDQANVQRAVSQEQSTGRALQTTQVGQYETARANENRNDHKYSAQYNDYSRISGAPDYACSYMTADATTGAAATTEHRERKNRNEATKQLLASASGTPEEDGATDGDIKLYAAGLQHCAQSNDGGSRVDCAGGNNDHLTYATALSNYNMTPDQVAKMDYLQQVAYRNGFESLNPDLYKNPNTRMKGILVEADRARMLSSIAPAVMDSIIAARTTTNGGMAVQKIRETLTHGGFLPTDVVDDIVPSSGLSWMGLNEAAGLALRNPNYMKEKYANDPELVPITIAYASGVQISQLNKIIQLLEFIAVGTTSDLTLQAEDLKNELNREIVQQNSTVSASLY